MNGGPARVARPENPADYDNEAWIDYLTHQPNPVGITTETWWHARGCGAWFTVQRDTTSHVIIESANEYRNDIQIHNQGNNADSTQSDNTAS